MEQAFYYFYFYPPICGPNDPQLYSLLNFIFCNLVLFQIRKRPASCFWVTTHQLRINWSRKCPSWSISVASLKICRQLAETKSSYGCAKKRVEKMMYSVFRAGRGVSHH